MMLFWNTLFCCLLSLILFLNTIYKHLFSCLLLELRVCVCNCLFQDSTGIWGSLCTYIIDFLKQICVLQRQRILQGTCQVLWAVQCLAARLQHEPQGSSRRLNMGAKGLKNHKLKNGLTNHKLKILPIHPSIHPDSLTAVSRWVLGLRIRSKWWWHHCMMYFGSSQFTSGFQGCRGMVILETAVLRPNKTKNLFLIVPHSEA